MSPSNNTQFGSTENITISNEATIIPYSLSRFVTKSVLDTTVQDMFDQFDKVQNKNDAKFDKQHEELVSLKLETLSLSEDTKVIK